MGTELEAFERKLRKDFFVSYNQADRVWAEWIAWQLEEAGYATVLQAWDFRPGGNFVLDMDQAAKEADRTIAVLSPAYLGARFTKAEWVTAFARDPTGQERALVPVRVRECHVEGVLGQIVYVDLVDRDESAARDELLEGVQRTRAKPLVAPDFPGSLLHSIEEPPRFPGASVEAVNLLIHADAPPKLLFHKVVNVLRDPQRAAYESTFRQKFDELPVHPHDSEATLRGAIGFFLFTLAADSYGPPTSRMPAQADALGARESAEAALKIANGLLEDSEVRYFLYQLYGFLPRTRERDYVGAPVRLLAVGTTSYILEIRVGKRVVLKLVQPRYFDIASIERATLNYRQLVEGIEGLPTVHESTERYILMDRVDGDTLGAYVRELRSSADTSAHTFDSASLTKLRDIFVSICSKLDLLHVQGLSHGDLSLDNVLVIRELGPGGKIYEQAQFIDFGPNYLRTEAIGDPGAFRRVQQRAAPELLAGALTVDAEAVDMYAFGVLLLAALLWPDFDDWNTQAAVDMVGERFTNFGPLVDDLLDPDPRFRGLETTGRSRTHRWVAVGQAVARDFECELGRRAERDQPWHQRLMFAITRSTFRAALTVVLAALVVGFPWLPFPKVPHLLTLPDGLESAFAQTFARETLSPWWLGDIVGGERDRAEGWLGWLLASAFALVAAKYYVSIVAGQPLPGFAARTAALSSWVFFICCLGILYSDKTLWAAWSVAGTGLGAINNLACLQVCQAAQKTMREYGVSASPAMREASAGFRKWTVTSLLVAVALLVSAAAFRIGWAHPDPLYAFVALGMMAFTYVIKCSNEAPVMRLGLARLLRAYYRGLWKRGSATRAVLVPPRSLFGGSSG